MATDKYGNSLTCQLCSHPYTDPRVLPCLHSFCRQCLDKEAKDASPTRMITCPVCQGHSSAPLEGGAGLLPRNLYLVYKDRMTRAANQLSCERCTFSMPAQAFCFQCSHFLCKECQIQHQPPHGVLFLGGGASSSTTIITTTMGLLSFLRPMEHCCQHSRHRGGGGGAGGAVLGLYCQACRVMICRECASMGDHREHRYCPLPEVAREHREGIRGDLGRAQDWAAELGKALDLTDEALHRVERDQERGMVEIARAFDEAHSRLEGRRRALVEELEEACGRRRHALDHRRAWVQGKLDELHRHCWDMFHTLQAYSDQEVVAMEAVLPLATSRFTSSIVSTALDSSYYSGTISVSVEVDKMLGEVKAMGHVEDSFPHPPTSTWTPKSVAKVQEPFLVTVTMATKQGGRCFHKGVVVEATLVSKVGGRTVTVSEGTRDHGDGTYTITLTPTSAGTHTLSVTMDGQEVGDGPRDLEVCKPREFLDFGPTPSQEVANVRAPMCLTVARNGDIFVGCKTNVQVFDKEGTLKHTIGEGGREDGQFNGPRDLALCWGVLYVADCANHRVQKFTLEGKFLLKFGGFGKKRGQLFSPCGLATDEARGRVYVCEGGNDRVQAFEKDGQWLMSIYGTSHGPATFHHPRGIAVDALGNIHVAAHGSPFIMVLTPGGRFARNYGNLKHPGGIAISSDGYSFVNKEGGGAVVVFDTQGKRVRMKVDLESLTGVAVQPKTSSIYVVSKYSSAVLKYTF